MVASVGIMSSGITVIRADHLGLCHHPGLMPPCTPVYPVLKGCYSASGFVRWEHLATPRQVPGSLVPNLGKAEPILGIFPNYSTNRTNCQVDNYLD